MTNQTPNRATPRELTATDLRAISQEGAMKIYQHELNSVLRYAKLRAKQGCFACQFTSLFWSPAGAKFITNRLKELGFSVTYGPADSGVPPSDGQELASKLYERTPMKLQLSWEYDFISQKNTN